MKQTPNCVDNEKWIGLACSPDEYRPVITNFKKYEDGTMVATNTHTLHVLLPKDKKVQDYEYSYYEEEKLDFEYMSPNPKKFAVVDKSNRYPNWTRVVPSESTRSFTVDSSSLMHTLIPFKKYAEACASRVRLRIDGDALIISCLNVDILGELTAKLAIHDIQNCDGFTIAVNVEYLIDAIRLSPEADKYRSLRELMFKFTENSRPMVVEHAENTYDQTTRLAVIMPMALY